MTSDAKARAASLATKVWARGSARVARLRTSAMLVLLLLLVGVVFVLPALIPSGTAREAITDIALILILATGVAAVADHRRLAIALGALSALVIVLHGAEWLTPVTLHPNLRSASTLSALLLLAVAVSINVFAPGRSIGDRLSGAIVLYLLLGLVWGIAYFAIERHAPGSFSGHQGGDGTLADWVYFSFVTLTTVGYGDVTPVATGARSIAILEALVGQLYPAIIIARLVSLQTEAR